MRVSENSADRLILEERPWVFGIILIAAILGMCALALSSLMAGNIRDALGALVGIALLGLVFWGLVRRTFVIFDRASGSVTWREQSLTGLSETTHPLDSILRADTEESQTIRKRGHKPTLRPVLCLGVGEGASSMPLHSHYTSGAGPGRTVETVNAWLAARG